MLIKINIIDKLIILFFTDLFDSHSCFIYRKFLKLKINNKNIIFIFSKIFISFLAITNMHFDSLYKCFIRIHNLLSLRLSYH